MRRVALISIGLLLMAPFAAAEVVAWTGYYLRSGDSHRVHWDDATTVLSDTMISVPEGPCGPVAGKPLMERCGECDYVPDTDSAWKSDTFPFSVGRCVNVDITDPRDAYYRADVRQLDGGFVYDTVGSSEFRTAGGTFAGPGPDIVLELCTDRAVYTGPPVEGASLTICHGVVHQIDLLDGEIPPSADVVCLLLAVWSHAPGYDQEQFAVDPCVPIPE